MDAREAALYIGQVFDGQSGERYEIGPKIGDGGFAGVFRAAAQSNGREVAVKILGFAVREAQTNAAGEFQDEIAMLRTLASCSNIVTLLDHGQYVLNLQPQGGGVVLPLPVPFMVLELAVGSLEDLLANRHRVEWLDRLLLFREMVKGVHQMHLERMVHRDVKSQNGLLFETNARARVCDLGRSKDTRAQPRVPPVNYEAGRGDVRFAPPDLLWGLGDTTALGHLRADLYLLGSLLFEIATATGITSAALVDPFRILQHAAGLGSPTARELDYRQYIPDLRERYELVCETFAAELPNEIRHEGAALLRQLTDPDPARREPVQPFRNLPLRWDLQWLLVRTDILIKRLATNRRASARPRWARRGKAGVRR
jgi:eukaryotic-like serine/threonine-protein kinase